MVTMDKDKGITMVTAAKIRILKIPKHKLQEYSEYSVKISKKPNYSFVLYSFATEKMFILRKSHLKVKMDFLIQKCVIYILKTAVINNFNLEIYLQFENVSKTFTTQTFL